MIKYYLQFICVAWLLASDFPSVRAAQPGPATADVFGTVEKISQPVGPHWLWVYDTNFISFSDGRAHLIDGDSGRYLGSLNTGYVHSKLNLPASYREIYSVETYYSRHVSGVRTDLVRVYDPVTLTLIEEIPIPVKRATTIPRLSNSSLSENDRFLLIFNLTPATSVSVVDLRARKFVGEFEIPGCGGVYPARGYRFMSLCGDGTLLVYSIDESGTVVEKKRTDVVFDAGNDPLIEYAIPYKDGWMFNSMESRIYRIDTTGAQLRFHEPWSLVSDRDREAGWRIGGMQQLAINEAHDLLFTIMHHGHEGYL